MGKILDIILSTPLGKFNGKAEIIVEGEAISGSISLLGTNNKVEGGTIDAEGNIAFAGEFASPVGKITYTLSGSFKDDVLDAVAKTNFGDITVKSI